MEPIQAVVVTLASLVFVFMCAVAHLKLIPVPVRVVAEPEKDNPATSSTSKPSSLPFRSRESYLDKC